MRWDQNQASVNKVFAEIMETLYPKYDEAQEVINGISSLTKLTSLS